MKPTPNHRPFISLYKKKFMCMNEEDRYLQGSFDTSRTRNIRVRLNRCRSEEQDYCKSDDEITDFVKGKYILLYKN